MDAIVVAGVIAVGFAFGERRPILRVFAILCAVALTMRRVWPGPLSTSARLGMTGLGLCVAGMFAPAMATPVYTQPMTIAGWLFAQSAYSGFLYGLATRPPPDAHQEYFALGAALALPAAMVLALLRPDPPVIALLCSPVFGVLAARFAWWL